MVGVDAFTIGGLLAGVVAILVFTYFAWTGIFVALTLMLCFTVGTWFLIARKMGTLAAWPAIVVGLVVGGLGYLGAIQALVRAHW